MLKLIRLKLFEQLKSTSCPFSSEFSTKYLVAWGLLKDSNACGCVSEWLLAFSQNVSSSRSSNKNNLHFHLERSFCLIPFQFFTPREQLKFDTNPHS